MKRKRYLDEQIAFALRQADGGAAVEEICRNMGVSEATFNRWKRIFTGMGVAEIRAIFAASATVTLFTCLRDHARPATHHTTNQSGLEWWLAGRQVSGQTC